MRALLPFAVLGWVGSVGCDEPLPPPPEAMASAEVATPPPSSSARPPRESVAGAALPAPDPAPRGGSPAAAVAPMFETGAADKALERLRRKLEGPLMALDVAVFPAFVRVQLQPADDARAVMMYEVRGDKVSGPVPVQLSGGGSVAPSLFRVDREMLGRVPEIVRAAERALGEPGDAGAAARLPGARADYVSLARDLPFSRRLLFRVFVTAPDQSGYADFDAEGRLLEAETGSPR